MSKQIENVMTTHVSGVPAKIITKIDNFMEFNI